MRRPITGTTIQRREFLLLTGTAFILVVLVFMGQRVWLKYYFDRSA